MHQPCRLVTFLLEFRNTITSPRSRPWGRRILYASRTTVLILSAEITLTSVSEYSNTASVFSSCAGRGALTSACIHWGALAVARGAYPKNKRQRRMPAHGPAGVVFLVAGIGSAG